MKCTPFVRQYDILSNKWGDFLCQKEHNIRSIHQNSKNSLYTCVHCGCVLEPSEECIFDDEYYFFQSIKSHRHRLLTKDHYIRETKVISPSSSFYTTSSIQTGRTGSGSPNLFRLLQEVI